MRKILLGILFITACSSEKKEKINQSSSETYIEDSVRIEPPSFIDLLQHEALIYSDSLNNSDIHSLPKFLFDVDFDYRDTFLLSGGTFHAEHYSLRMEVFKNVNRKDILEFIAKDSFFVNQFNKVRSKKHKRRFDFYSNSDLANLRLIELDNGIDTLSVLQ